jgi:hypothetical protein
MGFACAGAADQHGVALVGNEGGGSQIPDQGFVDGCAVEDEVIDILGKRQFGDLELVADGAGHHSLNSRRTWTVTLLMQQACQVRAIGSGWSLLLINCIEPLKQPVDLGKSVAQFGFPQLGMILALPDDHQFAVLHQGDLVCHLLAQGSIVVGHLDQD